MSDILNFDAWKNDYKTLILNYKESQLEYYKKNNAPFEVLEIVALESKRFGSISEKIISKIFKLEPRTSSQNDGIKNGKKIEIKCARYWSGKDECRWQHLELEHDYDYVLLGLLDFDGSWKIWGIKKSTLIGELREKKILTYQGKQGWWCEKSKVIGYCKQINNIVELDQILETI